MAKRLFGGDWADERLSYEANDWVMAVMARESSRATVTAVHSYEDCSLLQFQAAARSGKARIYDLPIGYYPALGSIYPALLAKYADWLPQGIRGSPTYTRPEQKKLEMELADLVMVPSTFVQRTVQTYADRKVAVAPYGVDSKFWCPGPAPAVVGPMRFIYAGQCSIRKGVPMLLQAWKAVAPKEAVLELVGSWRLAEHHKHALPKGVVLREAVSPEMLRDHFRSADVLVLPSYFEGLALVILEAMACGLPVIASDASGGADVIDTGTGRILPTGDLDALVEAIRWAESNRERLARMRSLARRKAEAMNWSRYRARVRDAVTPLLGI